VTKVALTDMAIQAMKAPEQGQSRFFDTTLRGFGILVGKKTKTFILVTGKQRKLDEDVEKVIKNTRK
jgi:hypothetical protein